MEEKRFVPPRPPQALLHKKQESAQNVAPETASAEEFQEQYEQQYQDQYQEPIQNYDQSADFQASDFQQNADESENAEGQKEKVKLPRLRQVNFSPMMNWGGLVLSVAAMAVLIFFLVIF